MGLGFPATVAAAPALLGAIPGVKGRGGEAQLGVWGMGREWAHGQLAFALTPTLPAALHPRRDRPRAARLPASSDLSPLLGL